MISKRFFFLSILAASLALTTSCLKKKAEKQELDDDTKQFTEDANEVKGEIDNVDNDINSALNDTRIGRVRATYSSPLCGATIDTSQVSNNIVFFNFDGTTPCFSPSRTRAGQIKVQLIAGNNWADQGAKLKIDYINFKITRLSNQHSLTLNGTKIWENVNGNNWLGFLAGTTTLKYRERALNINVTFHTGAQATWNIARVTEWNFIQANAVSGIPYAHVRFTSSADSTINGLPNVDSWGTNQAGNAFTTQFLSPWVSNSYCGFWRPVNGYVVHTVNGANYTLLLGVDENGNTSTLPCAYGYKVTWTPQGGTTQTLVNSY